MICLMSLLFLGSSCERYSQFFSPRVLSLGPLSANSNKENVHMLLPQVPNQQPIHGGFQVVKIGTPFLFRCQSHIVNYMAQTGFAQNLSNNFFLNDIGLPENGGYRIFFVERNFDDKPWGSIR